MNIQIEKLHIIQKITGLNDEKILKQLNEFLDKTMCKSSIIHQPMDLDTFYSMIEESEQAYQNNEVITHEDLKKEISSWKKR